MEILIVFLKRAEDLLKNIKLRTCKVLAHSKLHQGTHLDVKGLVVWRIEVNIALKTVTEK